MPPKRLTGIQIKILVAIRCQGGEFRSLNRLAQKLGINYSHAWYLVQRLEAEGHIRIRRTRRDMVLIAQPGQLAKKVGRV